MGYQSFGAQFRVFCLFAWQIKEKGTVTAYQSYFTTFQHIFFQSAIKIRDREMAKPEVGPEVET